MAAVLFPYSVVDVGDGMVFADSMIVNEPSSTMLNDSAVGSMAA